MFIDVLTITVGLFSFVFFLLAHGISSRWVKPEHVLRSLKILIISFIGLPVALTGSLFVFRVLHASWHVGACMAAMALLIHALLCFIYVLSVFGAYEASVRMRLLREIAKARPEGLSLEEILQRYNPEVITRLRLCRLIGSGYVIEQGGLYRASSAENLFFLFDIITRAFKMQLGR